MLILVLSLCLVGVLGAEFTLPGECPDVKVEVNLDPTRFSGLWYNVASYASDGGETHNCSILEFQEDNLGYVFKETYVEKDQGNRTQKVYKARVDLNFDGGNSAQFIMKQKLDDVSSSSEKVLQFPFFVLSTDYENYAVAYTCWWLKEKIRKHYVYTWVLTRSKDKLQGELLKKVENSLSRYAYLAEHKQLFVFKDFSDESCAYTKQLETDLFTSNLW